MNHNSSGVASSFTSWGTDFSTCSLIQATIASSVLALGYLIDSLTPLTKNFTVGYPFTPYCPQTDL